MIERQIVLRLAQRAGREPRELEYELRSADRDLPVDASEVKPILGVLESDFAVALPYDNMLSARLNYVRDLAILIQRRILARAQLAAGEVTASKTGKAGKAGEVAAGV